MADVFADTSGLANLVDQSEEFHELAKEIFNQSQRDNRRFITSNYLLAELVATLTSP